MKKVSLFVVIVAILVLAVTAVSAAVTFDLESGTGFVGKGDVQLAFGWNNATLQANAADLSFTYENMGEYTLVCSRIHDIHGYQEHTFKNRVIGIEAEVEVEVRANKNEQVTGFLLAGYGDVQSSGEGCPSGWPDEVSRTLNEDAGDAVGLFVHHPVYGSMNMGPME
jgi:hypothetical protein